MLICEMLNLKKREFATAVRLVAVAILAMLMVGCLVEGDEGSFTEGNVVGGQVESVRNPKGVVHGAVQDTNGNPIEGARVFLGGQETTTSAGGTYRFENVEATQTNRDEQGGFEAKPLNVVIKPPVREVIDEVTGEVTEVIDQYLGARVTVTPQAQAGASSNDQVTNPVGLFVDGYVAEADLAMLPALTASASGVLRNEDTGEPLANMEITLDTTATIPAILVAGAQDGDRISGFESGRRASVQTLSFSTTTNDNGEFSFTGIPEWTMRVILPGWTVASIDNPAGSADGSALFTGLLPEWGPNTGNLIMLADETSDLFLGNVRATQTLSNDDVNPFVAKVMGVTNSRVSTGVLNDDLDGTQGITIQFSEALQLGQVDDNSVLVYDQTNQIWLDLVNAPSLSEDGRTMTLTTASALSTGAEFKVYLLPDDFLDMGGNSLTGGATTLIGYDNAETVSMTSYVTLEMKAFSEPSREAGQPALAQLDSDDTGLDDAPLLRSTSNAFLDVIDGNGDNTISQLNAVQDDVSATSSTADRLQRLALEITPEIDTVEEDVARLRLTPDTNESASQYRVRVMDSEGNAQNINLKDQSANLELVNNNVLSIDVNTTDGEPIELALDGVAPQYSVSVTPMDGFGNEASTRVANLILADEVKPTTVIQNAYGATPKSNAVVDDNFGDGGQLSNIIATEVGTPFLNVTPRLLNSGNSVGELNGDNQLDELSRLAAEALADFENGGDTAEVYDANAWSDFVAGGVSRRIGVAFSENISVSGIPSFTMMADGSSPSTALSNWTANNDVTVTGQNVAPDVADLAMFDVTNVLDLANLDGNASGGNLAMIDFADAVQDESGNVANAGTNAKVIINDRMPPLVTNAEYITDGNGNDQIVVTFNEPVSPSATDTMSLLGTDRNANPFDDDELTLDLNAPDGNFNQSARFSMNDDNTVMTISNLAWGRDLDRVDETSGDNDDNNDQGLFTLDGHAALAFSEIEDMNGNSWNNAATNMEPALFAIVDNVGDFDVNVTATNFVDGQSAGQTFTVTYTFTHPIDLQDYGAAESDALTDAEVANGFNIGTEGGGNATIDSTGSPATGAELTNSGKTLTVTIEIENGSVASNDEFEWDGNFGGGFGDENPVSTFDSTDTIDATIDDATDNGDQITIAAGA